MTSDDSKVRKRGAMVRVRAVEEILRRWDPIGVEAGKLAPLDEYDSYAPQIVSLVAQRCSVDELSAHLHTVRTEVIGVGARPDRDVEVAADILTALREKEV